MQVSLMDFQFQILNINPGAQALNLNSENDAVGAFSKERRFE